MLIFVIAATGAGAWKSALNWSAAVSGYRFIPGPIEAHLKHCGTSPPLNEARAIVAAVQDGLVELDEAKLRLGCFR